jgi:hypothetical protein
LLSRDFPLLEASEPTEEELAAGTEGITHHGSATITGLPESAGNGNNSTDGL